MNTSEVSVPEIDFFQSLPHVSDLLAHQYIKIYPNQGWSGSYPGSIIFDVEPSATQMTSTEFRMYTRWKIVNNDGESLAVTDLVSTINQPFLTIFSDIQLKLGETICVPANGLNPYKIYLETLLGYGKDIKDTTLRSMQLYHEDTPGKFDVMSSENAGWEYRRNEVAASSEVELEGVLPFDFTQTKLFIIPGLRIQITLVHATDNFRLLTGGAEGLSPKLQISECYLTMRRVTVNSTISLRMEAMLNSGLRINHFFRRGALVSHQILTGSTEFNDTVFVGDKPLFIICFFVASDSFQGNYKKNPFKFESVATVAAQANFNGRLVPNDLVPISFSAPVKGLSDLYIRLLELSGLWNSAYSSNGLTKQMFVNGYSLFCFSLSQSQIPSSDYREPIETGRTRLYFRFSSGLLRPYNLLVYGAFQNSIQVDKNRIVTTDYTVGAA